MNSHEDMNNFLLSECDGFRGRCGEKGMVRTFAVVVLPGTSSDREETITRQCSNKCDHVRWQICRGLWGREKHLEANREGP